jgi:hypothetical protein
MSGRPHCQLDREREQEVPKHYMTGYIVMAMGSG